ncbi:MAG: DAK2 domain-containing protein [Syntrophomonadaceae bacterium]|nr:DAK2 domain-containing protein [Syntrophomonadaceae bacterium]
MGWKQLRAKEFKKAFYAGYTNLTKHKEEINLLNVFPVPDGDTGTNMVLTMEAAIKEAQKVTAPSIGQIVAAASMGALMGARGNSGVILSQLIRGFSQKLAEKDLITGPNLAVAFQGGVDVAYKAVIKPVEGTILTVAKSFAKNFSRFIDHGDSIPVALQRAVQQADITLKETPKMLPVLAQAGVVDAGGKGLLRILEGVVHSLLGQDVFLEEAAPVSSPAPLKSSLAVLGEKITFTYCAEMIIKGDNLPADVIRSRMEPLGDSLLVVGTEQVLKVHIHTDQPGDVLNAATAFGTMHHLKIDNMRDQHRESLAEETSAQAAAAVTKEKETGVLAVVAGSGLVEIIKSMGADEVISGGQTMNPSIEDIVEGINRVLAKRVIVLPNNKNIILAAEQAAEMVQKEVAVIPTRSFPQGLSSLLAFDPAASLPENREKMTAAIKQVTSGEITYAIRDSQYNGLSIQQGDLLGLVNGEIKLTGQDLATVTLDLLEKMITANDAEIATLFAGEDVNKEDADELLEALREKFPGLELEMYYGGQPLYYYIISAE